MDELKEELGKYRCEESRINNLNELYVDCSQSNIEPIAVLLKNQYKLKFIAEFCMDTGKEDKFKISIVFTNSKESYFVILTYTTVDILVSMQNTFSQAHLFEREISDLFGLSIDGGSDVRHSVKHEIWDAKAFPLRKGFPYKGKIKENHEIPNYEFKRIVGNDAFQIPVGPIHAGIIEPGHFRFSVIGEDIENLEIRLNYKHRGIEKIAENIDANKLNLLFERVACESTLAYGEAYALLIEKMLNFKVSREIQSLRVALLELERLYNFLQDVSGICVDVGFSYPAKKLSYIAEIIKQLIERVTGSRYARNSIVPMGSNIDFSQENKRNILDTLGGIRNRIKLIADVTLESFTFLDRVENTGIVKNNIAKKLMMTGVVGRASGVDYDVRKSFPYEIYGDIKKTNNIEHIGGVFERYKLKIAEIDDAFKFIEMALSNIDNEIKKNRPIIELEKGMEAISIVETAKGELMVYGKMGENNKFDRIYFKTPSFTNWKGLTIAVLDEIVPDFPLCNKSFNMSYSENDR
ncbi:MAG: NADH-quinone oxidoreductase subunit C [Peptostreptococcaceae bacterium]|nr:NADH-quinone oxidoreductase subunit C [Peptostreptococcaceae bacterium]